MREVQNIRCAQAEATGIDAGLTLALGLQFPQAYQNAESMKQLALAIKEKESAEFCVLPFCHTVEGEALGGIVNYGDGIIGPRAAATVCRNGSDVLNLPAIDYASGRIAEVLKACRQLSARGESVILNVSGPLTVLNVVMDTLGAFRLLMKETELSMAVLYKLRVELVQYVKEAVQSGVAAVSYADAMGAADIVGPEMASQLAKRFTVPFLKQLERELGDRILVILCPKTACSLTGSGLARWEEAVLPEPMSYGRACRWLTEGATALNGSQAAGRVVMQGNAGMQGNVGKKQMRIVGEMCTKNMTVTLESGVIETLKLSDFISVD